MFTDVDSAFLCCQGDRKGEEMSYHIRTLASGTTFGELALIRNMRRDFTAVSKGKQCYWLFV